MKKKISLIILSLIMLLSSINLLGCKQEDQGDNENMLTPEQQVQEIKRINEGAYNAYFGKSLNASTLKATPMSTTSSIVDDYLDEHGTTGGGGIVAFDLMVASFNIITDVVVNEKDIEVLTKSYTLNNQTDIVSKVTNKVDINDNLANLIIMFSESITNFNILGTEEKTLYFKASSKTAPNIDWILYYNNDSDYSVTAITYNITSNTTILHFDKQTSKAICIDMNNDDINYIDYVKGKTAKITKTNNQEIFQELTSQANGFINNFNSTIATFPAKTETEVLMFKWDKNN